MKIKDNKIDQTRLVIRYRILMNISKDQSLIVDNIIKIVIIWLR